MCEREGLCVCVRERVLSKFHNSVDSESVPVPDQFLFLHGNNWSSSTLTRTDAPLPRPNFAVWQLPGFHRQPPGTHGYLSPVHR